MGWINNNGVLSYEETNGFLYVPKASEVYQQVIINDRTDARYKSLQKGAVPNGRS